MVVMELSRVQSEEQNEEQREEQGRADGSEEEDEEDREEEGEEEGDEPFSDLQGFAEVAFLLASRTMSMIRNATTGAGRHSRADDEQHGGRVGERVDEDSAAGHRRRAPPGEEGDDDNAPHHDPAKRPRRSLEDGTASAGEGDHRHENSGDGRHQGADVSASETTHGCGGGEGKDARGNAGEPTKSQGCGIAEEQADQGRARNDDGNRSQRIKASTDAGTYHTIIHTPRMHRRFIGGACIYSPLSPRLRWGWGTIREQWAAQCDFDRGRDRQGQVEGPLPKAE